MTHSLSSSRCPPDDDCSAAPTPSAASSSGIRRPRWPRFAFRSVAFVPTDSFHYFMCSNRPEFPEFIMAGSDHQIDNMQTPVNSMEEARKWRRKGMSHDWLLLWYIIHWMISKALETGGLDWLRDTPLFRYHQAPGDMNVPDTFMISVPYFIQPAGARPLDGNQHQTQSPLSCLQQTLYTRGKCSHQAVLSIGPGILDPYCLMRLTSLVCLEVLRGNGSLPYSSCVQDLFSGSHLLDLISNGLLIHLSSV